MSSQANFFFLHTEPLSVFLTAFDIVILSYCQDKSQPMSLSLVVPRRESQLRSFFIFQGLQVWVTFISFHFLGDHVIPPPGGLSPHRPPVIKENQGASVLERTPRKKRGGKRERERKSERRGNIIKLQAVGDKTLIPLLRWRGRYKKKKKKIQLDFSCC